MNIERETCRSEWIFIVVLVLINLAAKGAFIGINSGEYTDGILQLTVFSNKAGLYPPLYGALAHGLSLFGLSLEAAARIISLIAAALCVVPIYWIGRRLGGDGAARIAALLYTVSPMPWRWSVRVMTDSLYLLLSTLAMALLMEAWMKTRSGAMGDVAKDVKDKSGTGRYLAGAVAVAGLAALTRYQGVLIAPMLLFVFIIFTRRFRAVPWLAVFAGIIWFALPAWMYWNGFAHQGQLASRTTGSSLTTVFAWWNTFESFVLISPYYLGYPIALAAVAGVFHLGMPQAVQTEQPARHSPKNALLPAAILWAAYAAMLLILHAMFGSFQYRYMMPLLPIMVALAAVGFSELEKRFASRRLIFSIALLGSVIYLVVFSLAILILQRETYGDQREAAAFIKQNVPPNTPIYSNERYGSYTDLGSVKLSFWSGHKVTPLLSLEQPIPSGAILILGTAYGGDAAVGAMMQSLATQYQLQPLTSQPFRSQITPIMDDIMVNPMFNQNPLAWVMRYVPQHFATQIFVVQPKAANED